jgi:hypothetical protein
MSWVKVDDQFPRHRKVQAAGAELGKRGIGRVISVWLEGQCYAAGQLTDGFIPRAIVANITSDDKPFQVAEKLVKYALWHDAPGGYQIHDYEHYNPSAVKSKAQKDLKSDRMRRWREQREAEREAKRRERDALPDALPDAPQDAPQDALRDALPHARDGRARYPVPVPVPVPHPTGVEREPSRLTLTAVPAGYGDSPSGYRRLDRVHVDCAAHSERLCVPNAWHTRKARQLGEGGDKDLRAWYPGMLAALTDEDLAEGNVFKLLDRKFTDWRKPPSHVDAATSHKLGPKYAEPDWYPTCQHEPKCETGPMHRGRLGIEGAGLRGLQRHR